MGKNYRPGTNKKDTRKITSKGGIVSNHNYIAEKFDVWLYPEETNRAQRRKTKDKKPKIKL